MNNPSKGPITFPTRSDASSACAWPWTSSPCLRLLAKPASKPPSNPSTAFGRKKSGCVSCPPPWLPCENGPATTSAPPTCATANAWTALRRAGLFPPPGTSTCKNIPKVAWSSYAAPMTVAKSRCWATPFWLTPIGHIDSSEPKFIFKKPKFACSPCVAANRRTNPSSVNMRTNCPSVHSAKPPPETTSDISMSRAGRDPHLLALRCQNRIAKATRIYWHLSLRVGTHAFDALRRELGEPGA